MFKPRVETQPLWCYSRWTLLMYQASQTCHMWRFLKLAREADVFHAWVQYQLILGWAIHGRPSQNWAVTKLLLCFSCWNYNLLFLYQYWSVYFVVKVNIVYSLGVRTGKDSGKNCVVNVSRCLCNWTVKLNSCMFLLELQHLAHTRYLIYCRLILPLLILFLTI